MPEDYNLSWRGYDKNEFKCSVTDDIFSYTKHECI